MKIIRTTLSIFYLIFLITACDSAKEPLPILNIKKEGEVIRNRKEPCTIEYTYGNKTVKLAATIKTRGGSSSKFYKHSYTVKLDKKIDLCGIAHENDWIFNANYIDKTFMRHKISYDLYREMNEENIAPKSSYAFVDLNDDFKGLYVIMEKVNGGMIGVKKKDTMAMVFKEPKIYFENRVPINNIRDTSNYYDQRYPKIYNSDKTWHIDDFKNFLFYSSKTHFLSQINDWINIESVIDWHLLLLFTNNSDGILKNFYLYKIDSNTPFRIAIWDYDHSFGRDGDNEMNMMERELDCNRSVLLKRLMEIPGSYYPEALKKRWWELRQNKVFSYKNIDQHIKRNDKLIKDAVEKNFEIWPVNCNWYFDDNGYEQELQIIRDFTKLRIKQLDQHFSL